MDQHASRVVTVEIHGQQYPIRSGLDPAYVAELAAYVNEKMQLALRESPVDVVLMVDASSSVARNLDDFRRAALGFAEKLSPQDRISLIKFDDRIELLQDWTHSRLQLRRSLTWDRGKEMADHKRFTLATDIKVYFCDPRSPWQRGSNENTNGLLRQYFPKGTDLSGYSQSYLNKIALRLNQRPRKTLGFETPADKLAAVLH